MKKGTKNLLIVGAVGSAAILGIMALRGGSGRSPTTRLPEVDKIFKLLKSEAEDDGTEVVYEDSASIVLINKTHGFKITVTAQYRGAQLGFTSKIEQLSDGAVVNEDWEPAEAVIAKAESYGGMMPKKIGAKRGKIR